MASRGSSFALCCFFACLIGICFGGDIDYVKKMVDSPVDDIQWANNEVIFVLTEKNVLYRSADGGRSWQNQMRSLIAAGDSDTRTIAAIYISEADPNYVFFVGTGETSWASRDMGETYFLGGDVADVRLHPHAADWVLGSSMSPGCEKKKDKKSKDKKSKCYKTLSVSKTFGETWEPMVDYVVQFDWSPVFGHAKHGNYPSDTIIYATVHSNPTGNQKFGFWDKDINFVQTTDFFKTTEVLVEHGNRFLFGDYSFLFVAAVNPEHETEVSLKISRDNSTHSFNTAILPVDLTEHSYTILDTSEGAVFLHVNHQPFADNAYAGHVYTSDWSGLLYSLSLPFNHRSAEGKCDFEKVEGLEGIYLANFIDEEQMDQEEAAEKATKKTKSGGAKTKSDLGKKRSERLRTKTVITFDKGGEWNYLSAPKKDSKGDPVKCKKDCHLHLHGITDMYGPFYSAESATGLIMATGTVGKYLEHHHSEINTYLSRDAGLHWAEVAKGSHIYEFGDHGGLIIMADDESMTDSIQYSWDEGQTWTDFKISDVKFQIENIIIEPASLTQQFVVYGWQDDAGVLIYVDFSGLHENECQGHESPGTEGSDYELWTPSDGRMNGRCLMGHVIEYVRRKADHQCFNPTEFERGTKQRDCPCTEQDFECDFGYERSGKTGEGPCQEMDEEPLHSNPFEAAESASCVSRQTQGYRRVPGDTCVGGSQWDAVETPCASSWLPGSIAGKIGTFVFAVAVVGIIVALASKTDKLDPVFDWIKSFSGAKAEGYSQVPHNEDDAFYLNDEDFGPSPHLIDEAGQQGSDSDDLLADDGPSPFTPLPPLSGSGSSVPKLGSLQ